MSSKRISISERRPTEVDANGEGLILILRKGGAIREATYNCLALHGFEKDPLMKVTHWAKMLPKPE